MRDCSGCTGTHADTFKTPLVTLGADNSDLADLSRTSASKNELAGHNAATNTSAHASLFATKATAETIYTGAVCPASSGTQYYWTTGTNVTLSVGTLTAGKPVNIAKLNNTATNSITAIGKAGWVWTGGEMTNTITAG